MYDVVLVDDEEIILEGLRRAFPWASYGCRVTGTAVDGREGFALVHRLRPQILLTDIRMPNLDGLGMIAALKSEFPDLEIAVLTAFRDFDYAQEAIRLGVRRYLLKPSRMEELREAVSAMTDRLNAKAPGDGAAEAGAPGGDASEDGAGAFVVRAAVKYIDGHCTEHLHLSDVADNVYVSQWHLSKLINSHTHQSFFDLLNERRIARARELLPDPMFTVSEIALAVGYADVAHFSRIFKKLTGKTPGEYRAGLRR